MTDTIITAMARALFVNAYADAADNGELPDGYDEAGSGEDWMNVAPETPRRFENEAWRLAGKIEQLNGMSIICLFNLACEADNVDMEDAGANYSSDFGHCLAMQALGTGVSWFDDHERFPIKLPYVEAYLGDDDLKRKDIEVPEKRKLSKAYSARGADMGRPNQMPDEGDESQIILRVDRLEWVDGDYDEGGAYWGRGKFDHIYRAYNDDVEIFVRDVLLSDAKKIVAAILKNNGNKNFTLLD